MLLANSTPVLALRKESTTLPMVFVQVTDPIGNGFVPLAGTTGGNITGFTNSSSVSAASGCRRSRRSRLR